MQSKEVKLLFPGGFPHFNLMVKCIKSNCVTYLESLYKDHSRYPYQAPRAQGRPHGPFGAELLLQK